MLEDLILQNCFSKKHLLPLFFVELYFVSFNFKSRLGASWSWFHRFLQVTRFNIRFSTYLISQSLSDLFVEGIM